MCNLYFIKTEKLRFAIILTLLVVTAGCSLISSDNSGSADPGPIAEPYDVEIKLMDRKDYLVCCGDTLSAKSEFFFDSQNRVSQYEFTNFEDLTTLFNTYIYTDEDDQVDIIKRFLTQTGDGEPALTDSVGFAYNDAGQLTEITRYFSPDGSTIASSAIQYIYDENGRLKTILRGDRKVDYFYDERGNLAKVEDRLADPDTGELTLNRFETFRYGDVKNPFFRKQLTGIVFVLGLHRSLSPYALVEFNNFNTETDDPVSGGTIEYEVNEDGFPIKSRLIFQNFDGVSEGTVVETEFTYLE